MRNETQKPHRDLRSTMLNTKCNFVGLCVLLLLLHACSFRKSIFFLLGEGS